MMTWEIMEERDSDAEPDLWRQRESAAIADTTCKDNKRSSLVYDLYFMYAVCILSRSG